jgi:hypothetical protein
MNPCPIYDRDTMIDWLLRWSGRYDRNGWKNHPTCSWIYIHRTGRWVWPDSGEASGCNESA